MTKKGFIRRSTEQLVKKSPLYKDLEQLLNIQDQELKSQRETTQKIKKDMEEQTQKYEQEKKHTKKTTEAARQLYNIAIQLSYHQVAHHLDQLSPEQLQSLNLPEGLGNQIKEYEAEITRLETERHTIRTQAITDAATLAHRLTEINTKQTGFNKLPLAIYFQGQWGYRSPEFDKQLKKNYDKGTHEEEINTDIQKRIENTSETGQYQNQLTTHQMHITPLGEPLKHAYLIHLIPSASGRANARQTIRAYIDKIKKILTDYVRKPFPQ